MIIPYKFPGNFWFVAAPCGEDHIRIQHCPQRGDLSLKRAMNLQEEAEGAENEGVGQTQAFTRRVRTRAPTFEA